MLKLTGWKVKGEMPEGVKKMVIIEAPHTSNWDYLVGMLCISAKGVNVNVVIKKELFFWPLGPVLRMLGGIPLDRSGSANKVESLAKLFEKYDELYFAITPEGTRSLVTNWKKGYYYIALSAGVPIMLTAIDYPSKTGFIGELVYPTGDYDKDFKKIEAYYRDKRAKYPEKFNLSSQVKQKD